MHHCHQVCSPLVGTALDNVFAKHLREMLTDVAITTMERTVHRGSANKLQSTKNKLKWKQIGGIQVPNELAEK
jgi:hypothetical protein